MGWDSRTIFGELSVWIPHDTGGPSKGTSNPTLPGCGAYSERFMVVQGANLSVPQMAVVVWHPVLFSVFGDSPEFSVVFDLHVEFENRKQGECDWVSCGYVLAEQLLELRRWLHRDMFEWVIVLLCCQQLQQWYSNWMGRCLINHQQLATDPINDCLKAAAMKEDVARWRCLWWTFALFSLSATFFRLTRRSCQEQKLQMARQKCFKSHCVRGASQNRPIGGPYIFVFGQKWKLPVKPHKCV